MDTELIIGLVLALPIILGCVLLWFGSKKRKSLSASKKSTYRAEIARYRARSPSERILGYDKILDHILSDLGYSGTLADKLKKKPPLLQKQLQEIWRLHKIRNQIAHEMHASFDEEGDSTSFERILLSILR